MTGRRLTHSPTDCRLTERSSLMTVGRRIDYAVRALSYIAGQDSSRPVPRAEIETRQGLPSHFLAKVLRQLVTAGLLTSAPGVRGGFRLARPAAEISLCDVYESIEGRFGLMECVNEGGRFCCFASVCTQIEIWRIAQEQLRGYLDSVSLATVADQEGLVPRLAAMRPVCEPARNRRSAPGRGNIPHCPGRDGAGDLMSNRPAHKKVYIPGCPLRPEAFSEGILELQEKMMAEKRPMKA